MPSLNSSSSTASISSIKSSSSVVSQTSTAEYEHEPFDQYVTKVQQLCQYLWPSATEAFTIERLRGGSYNRIIGITPPTSVSSDGKPYILRVPRFDQGQQNHELEILRYVRERTSIPVADVVFSDATDDNPLGSPYAVQSRLPGNNLFDTYPSLTHEQRKSVAKDFGKVLLDQQAAVNRTSGIIETVAAEDGTQHYKAGRFHVDPEPEITSAARIPSGTVSVHDTFLTLFRLQEASIVQHFPSNTVDPAVFRRLATVAEEMNQVGLFKDVPNCLCHLDLMPRNMMVDIRDDASASLSGVLDWDSAIFAPSFIACSPPSWIWAWSEGEEENPAAANDTPESEEMRELKRIFEDSVGHQFLIYSYNPEYQMARRLFELALHGLTTNEAGRNARSLLQGWGREKVKFGLSSGDVQLDEAEEDTAGEALSPCLSSSTDEDQDFNDVDDTSDEHEASINPIMETTLRLERTHGF